MILSMLYQLFRQINLPGIWWILSERFSEIKMQKRGACRFTESPSLWLFVQEWNACR